MKEKNYFSILEASMAETRAVFVFECVAELVLGVFLIISPVVTQILSIVIGAILTGVGIFNIISYLMSRNAPFRQGLFTGVIMTALGIAFIAQADKLVDVISIILGVFTVFEGLSCCRRAFLMKQLNFDQWLIPFLISLAACIAGIMMLIYPDIFGKILEIIAGVLLIVEAAMGFWTIFGIMALRKKIKDMVNEQTSIIDTDLQLKP
ncbi:MAG: DUF308 domain-containing protein [Bacteroides sp.]|nr:DUF308 domain-containing protein [Eubacterium sp.]MCM1417827.1 DUF308 domain-containing protein [Roseburia sp.]MCM1461266.1 DUF308 domain-containing protein [Bacteroides sp.]